MDYLTYDVLLERFSEGVYHHEKPRNIAVSNLRKDILDATVHEEDISYELAKVIVAKSLEKDYSRGLIRVIDSIKELSDFAKLVQNI